VRRNKERKNKTIKKGKKIYRYNTKEKGIHIDRKSRKKIDGCKQ